MPTKPYDPGRVIVVFDGRRLSGFDDGTMVEVSYMTDGMSSTAGGDGEVVVVISRDERGKIKLTFLQTSASCDLLTAAALAKTFAPIQIEDLNGRSLHSSATAWVKKVADAGYGKDKSSREFELECNPLLHYVGGGVEV